jgi:hypothetical protein
MISELIVGPRQLTDGAQAIQRADRSGATVTTDAHGQLYEASRNGNLFMAHAIVTAPVIYTTAAGTGGPLIWNGSSNKVLSILKVGIGITVVTTVAAALGLTGNSGQTSAPTSTTAIDSSGNLLIGGPASAASAFRVGTVTNAGKFLIPLCDLHTGALTVDNFGLGWFDIAGAVTVPPNSWVSLAASATATTTVMQAAIIWEELPA